jgi:hypothetical protein
MSKKQSEKMREHWKDLEYRRKMRARDKKHQDLMQDPEYRKGCTKSFGRNLRKFWDQ